VKLVLDQNATSQLGSDAQEVCVEMPGARIYERQRSERRRTALETHLVIPILDCGVVMLWVQKYTSELSPNPQMRLRIIETHLPTRGVMAFLSINQPYSYGSYNK
jgi:hypothetical protein